ncbi:MAG: carboxypeptidase-like regulatory domain-containing protein [Pirellulaceae bacterium]|nr:carboxypeptidase-like regulatory domain-containing protein [Pirellulaceae bacterium]
MIPLRPSLWLILPAWFCCGCTGDGLPDRAPVSGIVTFNGRPLAEATVTFLPASGAQAATGRTNGEGRYVLGTFSTDDGAVLGPHRITVLAHGPDRPLRPGEMGSGIPGELTRGDPLIPTRYFAPETSGLAREVVAGKNEFDLELKD